MKRRSYFGIFVLVALSYCIFAAKTSKWPSIRFWFTGCRTQQLSMLRKEGGVSSKKLSLWKGATRRPCFIPWQLTAITHKSLPQFQWDELPVTTPGSSPRPTGTWPPWSICKTTGRNWSSDSINSRTITCNYRLTDSYANSMNSLGAYRCILPADTSVPIVARPDSSCLLEDYTNFAAGSFRCIRKKRWMIAPINISKPSPRRLYSEGRSLSIQTRIYSDNGTHPKRLNDWSEVWTRT